MAQSTSPTYYRYFPVARRDREWGLFVTTVGESRIQAGAAYPPGGHPREYTFGPRTGRQLDEYQLIYISAGSGWHKSAVSGLAEFGAGTVLLLFPGVWHSYAPAPATGWNEHWIGFNGDLARRLVQHGFFTPQHPVLPAGEEATLLSLFQSLLQAARGNHPALQQLMAGITGHMLAVLYSLQQSRLAETDAGQRIIRQAIARMREAPEPVPDMAALAAALKVSYRSFRRAFAHHTGMSPHHYALQLRLAQARDLLAQTSLPIKEIALRLGFEDPLYFSKCFRRKVGAPPTLWRARAQGQRPTE